MRPPRARARHGRRDPNHSDKRNLIVDEFRDRPARALGMIFSKDIAELIEDFLDLDTLENEESFDPVYFGKQLKRVFGKDERHIRMMITGRVLTKYHHHEFMENIGSPITL